MFAVIGTRGHDEHLAVPCGSYREAVEAYKQAQVEGWQGLRINKDDTEGAWAAGVRSAVREVFPRSVAGQVEEADAFGALVHRVRERAQLLDKAPCDVLRELDDNDLWFTGEADEPAAFLAAKIRDL